MIWEDPPEVRNASKDAGKFGSAMAPLYEEAARELRANPNRWARIRTTSQTGALSLVRRIKTGEIAAFSKGTFDACSRTLDDGAAVYARFVA